MEESIWKLLKEIHDLQLENIEKAVQSGLQQEIAEEKENSKIQSKGMEKKGRIFFLGADKGRGRELYTWKNYLEKAGLRCDFNILWTSKDKAYQEELSGILLKQPLSYEEYLRKAAPGRYLAGNCAGRAAGTEYEGDGSHLFVQKADQQ